MFVYSTQISLHHTDAFGRLFFARQFDLVYEAKEKLFEQIGLSVPYMLAHKELDFPLVHAESDYKAVLFPGDKITIDVNVEKIGETSVIFSYLIKKADGTIAGTAQTVNVCVNKQTNQKARVPDMWRDKLLSQVRL